MNDQAEKLRLRLKTQIEDKQNAKAIAVVSGKGGVGKSNFSLNFSLSLVRLKQRVLLIDMDIGMGNLDILMGKAPEYSIVDHLTKRVPLQDIVMEGNEGLHYIAGGTGLTQLINFDTDILEEFTHQLQLLFQKYDLVIFDMGAGISNDSLRILLSVHEIIVVTTPEPTSIMDAYATMKFIHLNDSNLPFYLVVNKTSSEKEGIETYKKISTVVSNFLGREITSLGHLPEDRTIQQAVKRQVPFLLYNPKSPSSIAIRSLTERYQKQRFTDEYIKPLPFVSKLKKFLFER
ncbi:MinD/ParA family protein [Neobacillus sp. D3-1R]|uniref:MinD/ParA family protein n=1 Tax=Neobacillus sp. D3-1R TaxID=3445778 RepID=UPI003F9F2FF2